MYLADTSAIRCIATEHGKPFGYVQHYPIDEGTRREYGYESTVRVYGMDQFIGEPAK